MSENLSHIRGQWVSCDKALPKPDKYSGFIAVSCAVLCSTGTRLYATLYYATEINSAGAKVLTPDRWKVDGAVYRIPTTFVVAWYRVPAPEIIWVDEVDEEDGHRYKVLKLKEGTHGDD